jgi:OmpA-OmpF porin, OOP family
MKKLIRTVLWFAFLTIAIAAFGWSSARAQNCLAKDESGKDISYLPRFPNSVRTEYKSSEYDTFNFPIQDSDVENKVEGKYVHIRYELCGSMSRLQIYRNYENAFKSKGWKMQMPVDAIGNIFPITAEKVDSQQDIWAAISVDDGGGEAKDEAGKNHFDIYFDVIEVQKLKQQVELDESQMKKDLDANGKIVLHGINFDTGKATIKPESKPLLDEIGKLLNGNPELKLSIEGHTDNVGGKDANQKLSESRAASVKDYLVKNAGINAARLSTKGFGDTKPVADNGTDAGKAQNRRVELVKIK